jgi:BirA family biotin operon repressor/biotin-[acetyl-CoA-carboxylase] ligase
MEARYLQLKANKIDAIDTEYLQKLFRLNEWKNYTLNNEVFEGKIIGVSAVGKLQMELKSSETREFYLNEIQFLSVQS